MIRGSHSLATVLGFFFFACSFAYVWLAEGREGAGRGGGGPYFLDRFQDAPAATTTLGPSPVQEGGFSPSPNNPFLPHQSRGGGDTGGRHESMFSAIRICRRVYTLLIVCLRRRYVSVALLLDDSGRGFIKKDCHF